MGRTAAGSDRPTGSGAENSGTEAIRGVVDDVRELFQQELRTAGSNTEAIRGFVDEMRELLQHERRTAQEELAGKARTAFEGVLFLGAAVVLGALAAGTSTVLIMRMLEKVLPPTMAAAVVTVVLAAAAGVLAVMGLAEVRRALPFVPERALDELREEIREVMPG
ncbi:phage holin family protein [Pseudonocardia halophobica]|uniref:phage holin family protein n=1 Tax=Pseudonocardia halophobica TaxID=29401 RepID=UPI003D8E09DA